MLFARLNTDGTLNTQVVLAGTDQGVFLSQDGGRTWASESLRAGLGALPPGPISDLVLARSTVGSTVTLYAAIPGQGVFRATLGTLGVYEELTPPFPAGRIVLESDMRRRPRT